MNRFLQTVMEGTRPKFAEFVQELSPIFEWLNDFERTPQDPEWHAEGNVLIHTGMVLEELYLLLEKEAAHLSSEKQFILILAAVFHDIAKPVTTSTREIKGIGRVVAPRHEERGYSYLAFRILELELPYSLVHPILRLVAKHNMPKRLVIKEQPKWKYQKLARIVDVELLYYLEVADMRGRICKDKPKQLEYQELFRLFSQEYGTWEVKNPYESWKVFFNQELASFDSETRDLIYGNAIRDAEEGKIVMPEEALAKSYGYRDSYPSLVMMCGPSGSGKSTWIQKNLPNYHLVSLDLWREKLTGKRADQSKNSEVVRAAKEELKEHLRKNRKVVWDATNLKQNYRLPICELGLRYEALVTYVIFHQPRKIFFSNNVQRKHVVPENVLHAQIDTMDWPYPTEAHRILYINEEGKCLQYEGGCVERELPSIFL